MKKISFEFLSSAFLVLVACSSVPVRAQQTAPADRDRIALERSEAESQYAASEQACYAKFAVNDCVDQARARRREILAALRRQEVALNDAERKIKGAERLRAIEERSSPAKQQQDAFQRAKAVADQEDRIKRAADKAAQVDGGSGIEAAPRTAKSSPPPTTKSRQNDAGKAPTESKKPDTEENRRRYQQRQDEALAHKQRVEKKLAGSDKPLLKPLPVPP